MRRAIATLAACAACGLLPAAAQPAAGPFQPPVPSAQSENVALAEAEQALESARAAHGSDSLELVPALLEAAAARARGKDYEVAATDYAEAVRLIETYRGAMDPSLLEPLRGLGLSETAAGDFASAAEALERALFVQRIGSGLYNVGQYELLEALAASYVGLGRSADAELKERTALELVEREFGETDVRISPALGRLAAWYHDQGRLLEEREMLERQVALLESAHGKYDPSLVEPLRAIALSFRLEYTPLPAGEQALERALAIHERHAGDPYEHARTLAALGDWYLVFKKRVRAFDAYAQAQTLLGPGNGDRLFGAPVALFYAPPRPPAIDEGTTSDEIAQGFVLVEYAVTETGRVDDVRVVESSPEGIMDHRVVKALSGARFRPRLEGGRPVRTEDLHLRHTFSYSKRVLASQ